MGDKVLVVGAGGREHALYWSINKSPLVDKVFCAPGNAGTKNNVPIDYNDIKSLREFATEKEIDLTVVGPEKPLVKGIVDEFEKEGLLIYGPSKAAAKIEGSKAFADRFNEKHGIPQTENFEVFDKERDAKRYIKQNFSKDRKLVVKADGLAAGKGSIVCDSKKDALEAVEWIMGPAFAEKYGDSGEKVVIEDRLYGEEASSMAIVDESGEIRMLDSAQDHKPVGEGGIGPNTGGMGAISPFKGIGRELRERIRENIIKKAVEGLKKRGTPFSGTLYAGLMIDEQGNPHVLEFNVRFGDPELQPRALRIKSDLYKYLKKCAQNKLEEMEEIEFSSNSAVCVIKASGGYPINYTKGYPIKGLETVGAMPNVKVFHSGTKRENNEIHTNGGRVLGVTSLAPSLKEAQELANSAARCIRFQNDYMRRDIGEKAIKYEGDRNGQ